LDVALPQYLHQFTRRGASRCRDDEVSVIGHQDIGMNPAGGFRGVFGQPVEINAIVFVNEETGLPVVATLDQMERDIGQYKARTTRHEWGSE